MIYICEQKKGNKSVFFKVVTGEDGQELSRRYVEIPLFVVRKDEFTWFLLYDDEMNINHDAAEYLNYDIANSSDNTRKNSANALKLFFAFLSLFNYSLSNLKQMAFNEMIRFLQGLNSNPDIYKNDTKRSSNTINGYLGIYRQFLRKRGIQWDALFEARVVKEEFSFSNDSSGTIERIQYINNLKSFNPVSHTVPKYISPDEFDRLYKKAVSNKDRLAMCLLRIMYCYGLRLGESLGLTTEDLQEVHRDNELVPILVIRNRISDNKDQYAKGLLHVANKDFYKSKDYTKSKSEIVIDYSLYELICDYVNEVHNHAMEKYPENYKNGEADIVSYRNAPETNHYIFLSSVGSALSGQTWGNYLKKYFIECNIPVDNDCRENNLSHRLRHGFAMLHAHYRKDPVNALQLKNMMRHKSISSTMVYYNPTQEEEFKIKEEFVQDLFDLIPSLKEGGKLFE